VLFHLISPPNPSIKLFHCQRKVSFLSLQSRDLPFNFTTKPFHRASPLSIKNTKTKHHPNHQHELKQLGPTFKNTSIMPMLIFFEYIRVFIHIIVFQFIRLMLQAGVSNGNQKKIYDQYYNQIHD